MTTHQKPSFELKLRRNTWAAGELTALPQATSSIKGPYF